MLAQAIDVFKQHKIFNGLRNEKQLNDVVNCLRCDHIFRYDCSYAALSLSLSHFHFAFCLLAF